MTLANQANLPNSLNLAAPFAQPLPTDPPVLECQGVTIQRSAFALCEDVTFVLKRGDICHVLGDNGTGKTTLLMQLAGLLPLLEGEVYWLGQAGLPLQPWYVAHQLGIEPQLTVEQNLRFLLGLYGIYPTEQAIAAALEWVGLAGFAEVACYQLSAGQSRRVGLARLWFAKDYAKVYPLWLLDEPLTALDRSMVARLEALLASFAKVGGAVLCTSHQPLSVANRQLQLGDYRV